MSYWFVNPNGSIVVFGPGAHLRIWRNWAGVAHDVLAAYLFRCFHSPGPGQCFREDDLASLLAGAFIVEVVSHSLTVEEINARIRRARGIQGLPWDFLSSNCQDTMSWIVTGKGGSFQRDALIGFGLALGVPWAIREPAKR